MVKIGAISFDRFPLLLAPMEDVSDPPFRHVCKAQGADLMYTEFISTEGLIRHAAKSLQKLDIYPDERPIGIQIFGGYEEAMEGSVDLVLEARPELIDINFGCPVKAVVCKDAGAALLRNVDKMVALTKSVIRRSTVPVTVKTRLGWDNQTKNVVEVVERLQDIGVAAVTIHGRTRLQMYKGEADWTLIGKIKEHPRIHIPIFGNGDIDSPQKALEYRNRYGVDGIMIGRAAIGYPWIFREIRALMDSGTILSAPSMEERVSVCKAHLLKSVAWKGDKVGIFEMRRHYASYFRNIPNIKPYRNRLVTEDRIEGVLDILDEVEDLPVEPPAVCE